MKRRAMKKWIPKNTVYCYTYKKGKIEPCKWWRNNDKKPHQLNGFCMYLNTADWMDDGTLLLWDMCKECGVKHF